MLEEEDDGGDDDDDEALNEEVWRVDTATIMKHDRQLHQYSSTVVDIDTVD